jgi:hypothetical protein
MSGIEISGLSASALRDLRRSIGPTSSVGPTASVGVTESAFRSGTEQISNAIHENTHALVAAVWAGSVGLGFELRRLESSLSGRLAQMADTLENPSAVAAAERTRAAAHAVSQQWWREARDEAEKAIGLFEINASAHLLRGIAHIELGSAANAQVDWSNAIRYGTAGEYEAALTAVMLSAGLYLTANKPGWALEVLRQADSSLPRCTDVLLAIMSIEGSWDLLIDVALSDPWRVSEVDPAWLPAEPDELVNEVRLVNAYSDALKAINQWVGNWGVPPPSLSSVAPAGGSEGNTEIAVFEQLAAAYATIDKLRPNIPKIGREYSDNQRELKRLQLELESLEGSRPEKPHEPEKRFGLVSPVKRERYERALRKWRDHGTQIDSRKNRIFKLQPKLLAEPQVLDQYAKLYERSQRLRERIREYSPTVRPWVHLFANARS